MSAMNQWFQVVRRELHIMRGRPIYLLGSVGVMVASALFFLTFMGEGLPEKLRIGVVDLDQSSTSRNFRQQLDATQMGSVVEFESVSAASRELESGRIYGYVIVPRHFDEDVQVGIMIETPAAAICSDRLAKEVDFFSCGTNDLTQYTLACDRQNDDLGRFFNPHHLAVLRELKMVCDNAHKNGIWVGICGELGADLKLTETFLSIGIDELSVSPRAVLPLRQKIRDTNVAAVKDKIIADLLSDEGAIVG